jgi:hypothetical protein
MQHGLSLTRKEKREAFKAFVRARQHVTGARFRTYEEIAVACPNCGGASTMHRWMKEDFPKVAAQISGGRLDEARPEAGRDEDEGFHRAAVAAFQTFQWNMERVRDRDRKFGLWEMARALKAGPLDEFDPGWEEAQAAAGAGRK